MRWSPARIDASSDCAPTSPAPLFGPMERLSFFKKDGSVKAAVEKEVIKAVAVLICDHKDEGCSKCYEYASRISRLMLRAVLISAGLRTRASRPVDPDPYRRVYESFQLLLDLANRRREYGVVRKVEKGKKGEGAYFESPLEGNGFDSYDPVEVRTQQRLSHMEEPEEVGESAGTILPLE